MRHKDLSGKGSGIFQDLRGYRWMEAQQGQGVPGGLAGKSDREAENLNDT